MVKTYNIGAMKSRDSSSSAWESLMVQIREAFPDPELLENVALSDKRTPGLYYCPDATTRATLRGCPSGLGDVFTMVVYRVGSSSQCIQMIISVDRMFIRQISYTSGFTTDWVSYYPNGDSPPHETITQDLAPSDVAALDEGIWFVNLSNDPNNLPARMGFLEIMQTGYFERSGTPDVTGHYGSARFTNFYGDEEETTGGGTPEVYVMNWLLTDEGPTDGATEPTEYVWVPYDWTNIVGGGDISALEAIVGDGDLDSGFTATDLTDAANELLGDVGDLETIVGDGVLDSGFVATDLTGAVNELYNSGGGGGGGTSDYTDLSNKPSINSVTLSGNKTASDLGLGTYTKPSGGIPVSDINSAGLDQAIASWFGNNFTMYRRDLTEYLTPRLKADTSSASIEQFVIGNLSIIRVSIVMSGSTVIQGEALTDTGVNLGIGYHSGPAVGQAASGTGSVSAALRIGSSAGDGVLYCIIDGSAVYRTLRGIAVGWIEDEQGS